MEGWEKGGEGREGSGRVGEGRGGGGWGEEKGGGELSSQTVISLQAVVCYLSLSIVKVTKQIQDPSRWYDKYTNFLLKYAMYTHHGEMQSIIYTVK